MKTTNALTIRRSLGRVLSSLERGGEPVLVERAGKAVAALVSLEDFRERFADGTASAEREALVREIVAARPERRGRRSATKDVRRLRGPLG